MFLGLSDDEWYFLIGTVATILTFVGGLWFSWFTPKWVLRRKLGLAGRSAVKYIPISVLPSEQEEWIRLYGISALTFGLGAGIALGADTIVSLYLIHQRCGFVTVCSVAASVLIQGVLASSTGVALMIAGLWERHRLVHPAIR